MKLQIFLFFAIFQGYNNVIAKIPKKENSKEISLSGKCECMHMKYLRDLTPMFPVLKSWMSGIRRSWRSIEEDVGSGKELRISNIKLTKLKHFMSLIGITRNENQEHDKVSIKDYVKDTASKYFHQLESMILTNWIWGPRQNVEASKLIMKPVNKLSFDEKNRKLIPKVLTLGKYYMRTMLRSPIQTYSLHQPTLSSGLMHGFHH